MQQSRNENQEERPLSWEKFISWWGRLGGRGGRGEVAWWQIHVRSTSRICRWTALWSSSLSSSLKKGEEASWQIPVRLSSQICARRAFSKSRPEYSDVQTEILLGLRDDSLSEGTFREDKLLGDLLSWLCQLCCGKILTSSTSSGAVVMVGECSGVEMWWEFHKNWQFFLFISSKCGINIISLYHHMKIGSTILFKFWWKLRTWSNWSPFRAAVSSCGTGLGWRLPPVTKLTKTRESRNFGANFWGRW